MLLGGGGSTSCCALSQLFFLPRGSLQVRLLDLPSLLHVQLFILDIPSELPLPLPPPAPLPVHHPFHALGAGLKLNRLLQL